MSDYHSNEVQEILDKYVTADKYGEYKPILDEIIQRRQFEFRFSLERIEQEVKHMVSKLNEIKFGNQNQDILGEYNPEQKAILLNEDVLKKECESYRDTIYSHDELKDKEEILKEIYGRKLFAILAHEVYHSINYRDEGTCGVEHRTDLGGVEHTTGIELNEVFTERAATRVSKEKENADMRQGFGLTIGYENLTFISNLAAYSLGVSERELLSKGLNNHEELLEFVSSKFGNDTKKGEDVVDTIEGAASFFSKTFIQINNPKQSVAKGLSIITNRFFNIAQQQVSSDNRELSPEYVGEIFYRNYRLNTTINNFADLLLRNNCITQEGMQTIFENTLESRTRFLETYLGIADLAQMECTIPNAINAAKQGGLKGYAHYHDENGDFKEEGTTSKLDKRLSLSNEERMQMAFAAYKDQAEFYAYTSRMREEDYTQEVSWDTTYYKDVFNIIQEKMQERKGQVLKVEDITIGKLVDKFKLDNLSSQRNIEDEDDEGR